ncbi:hypothetical protein QJS66_22605 [Kocuria rhizophila]|nr:hypothetical protein QJS66_22605 [Kocuria rhizophila]
MVVGPDGCFAIDVVEGVRPSWPGCPGGRGARRRPRGPFRRSRGDRAGPRPRGSRAGPRVAHAFRGGPHSCTSVWTRPRGVAPVRPWCSTRAPACWPGHDRRRVRGPRPPRVRLGRSPFTAGGRSRRAPRGCARARPPSGAGCGLQRRARGVGPRPV